MPAAAPFPLLLLGLRRIAREPGRRSVALTVAALVLIGVAGHPETLLHACAAGGVYFLFELARSGSDPRRGSDPRSWLRPLTLALGAGALALGLLAVQLLPLAEALPHTLEHPLRKFWYSSQPRSVPAGESLSRLTPQVDALRRRSLRAGPADGGLHRALGVWGRPAFSAGVRGPLRAMPRAVDLRRPRASGPRGGGQDSRRRRPGEAAALRHRPQRAPGVSDGLLALRPRRPWAPTASATGRERRRSSRERGRRSCCSASSSRGPNRGFSRWACRPPI